MKGPSLVVFDQAYFDAHFIPNPGVATGGLAYLPIGMHWGKRSCPGCSHGEYLHVAGSCYACGHCGWSILGEGNSWNLPAGWHKWDGTEVNAKGFLVPFQADEYHAQG